MNVGDGCWRGSLQRMGRRQRRRLRGGKLAPDLPARRFEVVPPPAQEEADREVPSAGYYPPFVTDQHRYDLALSVAGDIMGEPADSYTTRLAASSIYRSGIPT